MPALCFLSMKCTSDLLATTIMLQFLSASKPNTSKLQKREGAPSRPHSRSATAGVCIQATTEYRNIPEIVEECVTV